MPYPIQKNKEQGMIDPLKESQMIGDLFPLIQSPYSLLQQLIFTDKDKTSLKKVWLASETKDNKIMKVSSNVDSDLYELKARGLIEFIDEKDKVISLTSHGEKLLKESILNDEKSSFTKQASKDMVLKNAYDFGDEILVRITHPENFGNQRYIIMDKKKFASKGKPQSISNYNNIKTKKSNGSFKKINEYSEKELIEVLHLAKKIINNSHKILTASKDSLHSIPINRIKSFSEIIIKELNSR